MLQQIFFRILGPTALLQLAQKKEMLPSINRPMYTKAMLGTIIVFTGFRDKDILVNVFDTCLKLITLNTKMVILN